VVEIKDNILIITVPADLDKSIFTEIIDFVNSRLNINRGKEILGLIVIYGYTLLYRPIKINMTGRKHFWKIVLKKTLL